MSNPLRRAAAAAAAILFPPRCVFCRAFLPVSDAAICRSCAGSLPAQTLSRIRSEAPFADLCMHPFVFEGLVRRSLHRYKFAGKTAYAKTYAKFARNVYRMLSPEPPAELVTWVPVSKKRKRQRGYDQAELFARALAAELSLPCRPLLRKITDTPPQSGLSRARRAANVLGAYEIHEIPPAGVSLLLCDDTITTGATVSECARVLKTAGAGLVYAAAVAKTSARTGSK